MLKFRRPRRTTRQIVSIGWPIAMARLSQILLVNIDFAFIGRISTDALAAVGVATTLLQMVIIIGASLSFGLSTSLANALGAKDTTRAGRMVVDGTLTGLLLGLVVMAFSFAAGPLALSLMGLDAKLEGLAWEYLRIFIPALIFANGSFMLGACFSAFALTRHLFVASLLLTVFNLAGDYALIFGNWGFPEMGIAGAAWASLIASVLSFGYLVGALWFCRRTFALGGPWSFGSFRSTAREIFRLGISTTVEWSLWFVTIVVINAWLAPFGAAALALYNVALKVQSLFMLAGSGINTANNVLVGRVFGAGRFGRIGLVQTRSLSLALLSLIPGVALLSIAPRQVFGVFMDRESLADVPHLGICGFLLAGLLVARTINGITGSSLRSMRVVYFFFYVLAFSLTATLATAYGLMNVLALGVVGAFLANLVDEVIRNLCNHWMLRKMLGKKGRRTVGRALETTR